MRASSALGLVALAALGCGDKSAVSFTSRIESPAFVVTQAALGDALSGSFSIVVNLGPSAESAATATVETLELVVAEGTALTPPLDPTPADLRFDVQPGKEVRRAYTFERKALLTPAERSAVCQGLKIRGAVRDELVGGSTTSVESLVVVPSGC